MCENNETPKLTPYQIKTMWFGLRKFGYKNLTEAQVREQAEKILRGEEPTNIIGEFIKKQIRIR
ncbi:MAG: hypothetical protein GWN86_02950 [Desulfobacterales bacterium]|nr:hypothetical protein [Desulfobacterales bacterium]